MEIKFRTQLGELLEHLGLKGHAVEIGVAEGRNAEVLIRQKAITKLYLIDSWQHLKQSGDGGYPQKWHDDNYKDVLRRTKIHEVKRTILRGLSSEMVKEMPDDSLILAYVDGDHSYKGCLTDLQAIYPKVKVGGVISCHDYLNLSYGVNDAVRDFCKEHGITEIHTTEENGDESMVSCWFIKK